MEFSISAVLALNDNVILSTAQHLLFFLHLFQLRFSVDSCFHPSHRPIDILDSAIYENIYVMGREAVRAAEPAALTAPYTPVPAINKPLLQHMTE